MPCANSTSEEDIDIMSSIKLVMDYSNLSYYQVLQLPCDIFKLMVKNQYINNLMQTQQGRQYLEDCKIYNIKEPDIDGLKQAGLIK